MTKEDEMKELIFHKQVILDCELTELCHLLYVTHSSISKCDYGTASFYNKEALKIIHKIYERKGESLEKPKDLDCPF